MADKEFEIWQLKEGAPDTPQMFFTNYDYMAKHDFPINMSTYDRVYAGMTAAETTPEDIYVRFNVDHPEDYRAHSLSVSDVVVFKEDGMAHAYFMDSIGYKELPEFFKQIDRQVTDKETRPECNEIQSVKIAPRDHSTGYRQ